jgi:hypothetical protein
MREIPSLQKLARDYRTKSERQIVLSRRLIRRACGVYFLIKGERIVYVGQAANVFARVGRHVDEARKDFDAWNFVLCPREELNSLERHYINEFRPPLNRDRTTLAAVISFRMLARDLVTKPLVPGPVAPETRRSSKLECR